MNQSIIIMKTALFALAAVAMPAMAGTYTVVEPQNPYSLELGVSYNFAARDIVNAEGLNTPSIDTMGVDLTGVYKVNDRSSFNLRFGFATGSDDATQYDGHKMDVRVNDFILMPGYRYTHPMGEYLDGFIGANVGVINESLKLKLESPDGETYRTHNSEYAFAYSAEVGLRYRISRHFEAFLAYQFFGSTADPGFTDSDDAINTREQLYHCVRLGMSLNF